MAGDLRELMHGAAESKRQLFSHDDFAGGYGRSIVGRVKRRRVVTTTAMSGGTIVAAGALAIGASNLPWNTHVTGAAPAGSPTTLCVTTTPDPLASSKASAATPSASTLTDLDGPTPIAVALDIEDIHQDETTLAIRYRSGEEQTFQQREDGQYFVTTPSGETFLVKYVELQEGDITLPGFRWVHADSSGNEIPPSITHGSAASPTPAASETELPGASPQPSVDCTTVTPAPDASVPPAPSDSPTPVPSESAAQTPTPSATPNSVSP